MSAHLLTTAALAVAVILMRPSAPPATAPAAVKAAAVPTLPMPRVDATPVSYTHLTLPTKA